MAVGPCASSLLFILALRSRSTFPTYAERLKNFYGMNADEPHRVILTGAAEAFVKPVSNKRRKVWAPLGKGLLAGPPKRIFEGSWKAEAVGVRETEAERAAVFGSAAEEPSARRIPESAEPERRAARAPRFARSGPGRDGACGPGPGDPVQG